METLEYKFKDAVVEFETAKGDVMVNATQMAKPFGKEVSGFLKTESTKNYIEAYCRTEDLPSEKEFTPEGKLIKVIKTGRNNGTWMDRRVALKFAAWLDPYFEVWIYNIIDELLFGSYKEDELSLKEIARIQVEIAEKEKALENSPIQKEIDDLKKKQKTEENKLKLRKKLKLDSYVSMFTPEEMTGNEAI